MTAAAAAALLESLDRHFLAGCPSLSTSQLEQHKTRGSCRDCTENARLAREEAERIQAEFEKYAYVDRRFNP